MSKANKLLGLIEGYKPKIGDTISYQGAKWKIADIQGDNVTLDSGREIVDVPLRKIYARGADPKKISAD